MVLNKTVLVVIKTNKRNNNNPAPQHRSVRYCDVQTTARKMYRTSAHAIPSIWHGGRRVGVYGVRTNSGRRRLQNNNCPNIKIPVIITMINNQLVIYEKDHQWWSFLFIIQWIINELTTLIRISRWFSCEGMPRNKISNFQHLLLELIYIPF